MACHLSPERAKHGYCPAECARTPATSRMSGTYLQERTGTLVGQCAHSPRALESVRSSKSCTVHRAARRSSMRSSKTCVVNRVARRSSMRSSKWCVVNRAARRSSIRSSKSCVVSSSPSLVHALLQVVRGLSSSPSFVHALLLIVRDLWISPSIFHALLKTQPSTQSPRRNLQVSGGPGSLNFGRHLLWSSPLKASTQP